MEPIFTYTYDLNAALAGHCSKGDAQATRTLLEVGADPTFCFGLPLCLAAAKGCTRTIGLLLHSAKFCDDNMLQCVDVALTVAKINGHRPAHAVPSDHC